MRIFVARRGTVRRQELRGGTPWGSDDGKTLSSPGPGAEKREIIGDTFLELTISTFSCFPRSVVVVSSASDRELRARFVRRLAAQTTRSSRGNKDLRMLVACDRS